MYEWINVNDKHVVWSSDRMLWVYLFIKFYMKTHPWLENRLGSGFLWLGPIRNTNKSTHPRSTQP